MATNKAQLNFFIDNQKVNAPVEWQNTEVIGTFDGDMSQANITIDKLTFVLAEYTKIINRFNSGLNGGLGVFQGLPVKMQVYNNINSYGAFDGFIDLSDDLEIDESRNKVQCKLRLKDGVFTLEQQLEALSFGYLYELGIIKDSDFTEINYLVEKKENTVELIILSLTLYILTKELIEAAFKLADAISTIAGILAAGIGGPISGLIAAAAKALYYAGMIIIISQAVIELGLKLISALVPVKRKAKTLKLKTGLEKVCIHIGLTLNTNITLIDECYYLPSNSIFDELDTFGYVALFKGAKYGYPNRNDYGYNVLDFFDLCKNLFNARFSVYNGELWFYNLHDPVWVKQSTYKLPLKANTIKRINANELTANRLYSFQTDITDEHTIDNFRGTNYEVITKAKLIQDKRANYIRGLKKVTFNVCLGNRKDSLTGFENTLANVAGTFDKVTNFFGAKSNLKGKITNNIGLLKVSTNQYQQPKILRLDSNKKLVDRDLFSAKYLYDNYYEKDSFVSNNYYGQKEIYNNITIPFGMNDFVKVINNSYFYDDKNRVGKITELKWNFSSDTATVSYWIRQIYDKNIEEIYVEPAN